MDTLQSHDSEDPKESTGNDLGIGTGVTREVICSQGLCSSNQEVEQHFQVLHPVSIASRSQLSLIMLDSVMMVSNHKM